MDLLTQTSAWLSDPAHWAGPGGIPTRLLEHVGVSALSLAVAILVAFPIGAFIGHTGRGAAVAVNAANIGRAVPSYAVMAMILPVSLALSPRYGLDFIPTFTAMTLLAIPPILVNTYEGVHEVDREVVEAGRGMGMRERGVLARVELPIAAPVVFGGIRTAAVQVVATATLWAVFGGGGIGRYIIDGNAQRDDPQLIAGVVLVAGLAIATEVLLALLQRLSTSPGLMRAGRQVRELA